MTRSHHDMTIRQLNDALISKTTSGCNDELESVDGWNMRDPVAYVTGACTMTVVQLWLYFQLRGVSLEEITSLSYLISGDYEV